MIMDFLKGLLNSNQETEADNETETPSSKASTGVPQNEWQGIPPWANPGATDSHIDANSSTKPRGFFHKADSAKDNSKNPRRGRGLFQRMRPKPSPNTQVNTMGRGTRPQSPGYNPHRASPNQPGGPFMPQRQPQQRQEMGLPLYGQTYGSTYGPRPPVIQRQMPRPSEWGMPVQGYNRMSSHMFGFPGRPGVTGYPPQYPIQYGNPYRGMPRRQAGQQFQGPWL